MTDIGREAKKIGQKKRLRTLKDLDKSALELAHICSVLLDENIDSELLRSTIFEKFPPGRLADTITFINAIARPPDASFHDEMVEQYGRVRRFLLCLLGNIEFSAAPAGESTLDAIRFLAALRSTRRQHIDDARFCRINDNKSAKAAVTEQRLNATEPNLIRVLRQAS